MSSGDSLIGWLNLKQLCFGSFRFHTNTLVVGGWDSSSMKSHQTIIGDHKEDLWREHM